MTRLLDVAVQHYQPRSSRSVLENLLRAAYQQLLGRQPYFHERMGELEALEKDFLRGKVGMRRLVRQIGHSALYQSIFFTNGCNTRSVEQGFKHFLGRAPISRAEVASYHDIISAQGLKAMVDAFLDSEEYRLTFGYDTLPYPRQHMAHQPPLAYVMSQRIHQANPLPMIQPPLLQTLAAH